MNHPSRSATGAALLILSAALLPAHAATPAASAAKMENASTPRSTIDLWYVSNAVITVAVTNDGGATQHTTGTFLASDRLTVSANIAPDPNAVGLNAEIFMVAKCNNAYYTRDEGGQWLLWDGMPQSLATAVASHLLPANEDVDVITDLSGLRGDFTVFVGYQVGGELAYNITPLTFTVE
ncbi:hypothetical protein [Endothiovibrio diazotrophicus]